MPRDFPELTSGMVLEPWMLNIIYDELNRWRRIRGATGGIPVSIDNASNPSQPPTIMVWPEVTLHLFLTTTVISKMVGTAPGSGAGTYLGFDGTNLSSTAVVNIPIYNFTENIIASGSYIFCNMWQGVWWFQTVDKCANLST